MKQSPMWVSLLSVVLPVAALGLCSWAMDQARKRGRELPGGTNTPSSLGPVPSWASGAPPAP
jgi:hypothetical protein